MPERIAAFLTVAALVGCAVPQPSRESELPPSGYAKLHVLRPAFSDVSRNESPTLYINEREAARLEFESYSVFTLKPGTYKLSVKPRQSESEVWTGEWKLSVQSDQIYFLAIWNDVEYRQEVRAWYLGLPMPYLVTVGTNKSLRSELVAEKDAVPVIQTLRYLRPIAKDFVPLP